MMETRVEVIRMLEPVGRRQRGRAGQAEQQVISQLHGDAGFWRPVGGRDLGDLDLLKRGLDRRSAIERPLAIEGLEAAGNQSRRRERRGKPQGTGKHEASVRRRH